MNDPIIRTFNTGATRNSLDGKLSYMRGLSPAVLQRYLEYLAEHRQQADGKLRAFDNWKHGIPKCDYLDSLLRHDLDLWLLANGEKPSDPAYDEERLLCAIMFNTMGRLFECLVARGAATREVQP